MYQYFLSFNADVLNMDSKELKLGRLRKIVTKEYSPKLFQPKFKTDDYVNQHKSIVFEKLDISTNVEDNICATCMGRDLACGRPACPIIQQFSRLMNFQGDFSKKDIFGASPPAVFIGRLGYPNISIGPMIPPISGDTHIMDETEQWWGLELETILDMRMSLIRGKTPLNTDAPQQQITQYTSNRFLDSIQEIALAKNSIEVEVYFENIPNKKLKLDADIQPMGPSAALKKLEITSNSTDQWLQKIFSDSDMSARDGIIKLISQNKTSQSAVTRAFSLGLFGQSKNRRLVPTRWSITAVDSTLGLYYWRKVVNYPLINEYRVYESNYMDNRFLVLMMPYEWGYELMEAFFPGSVWNFGENVSLVNDWEGLTGRKTYARIGGCYYAARNIIGQQLFNEHRQARVVILLESYPGFIMPLGVWLVRECVRQAINSQYVKFDCLPDMMRFVTTRMNIPPQYWIENSGILQNSSNVRQKSLYRFI